MAAQCRTREVKLKLLGSSIDLEIIVGPFQCWEGECIPGIHNYCRNDGHGTDFVDF